MECVLKALRHWKAEGEDGTLSHATRTSTSSRMREEMTRSSIAMGPLAK